MKFRVHFCVKGLGSGSREVTATRPEVARADVIRGLSRDFPADAIVIKKVKVAA